MSAWLDPRTRPLRWGLFLIGIAIVLVLTGPEAYRTVAMWLHREQSMLPWYATRLFAFLSYFALAGSVIYGLMLSSKLLDRITHRSVSFTLHQDLASIGLGLGIVHAALLTLDGSVPYSLTDLLVPFAGPYRPLWVGIGQLAGYLTLVIVLSYSVRRRIGLRAWRTLHYATFLIFVGSTVHGLMSGTDTSAPWAFWSYLGASGIVAFLFAYRVMSVAPGARRFDLAHLRRVRPSTEVAAFYRDER